MSSDRPDAEVFGLEVGGIELQIHLFPLLVTVAIVLLFTPAAIDFTNSPISYYTAYAIAFVVVTPILYIWSVVVSGRRLVRHV